MISLTTTRILEILTSTLPSYQATSSVDANLGFGFLFYGFTRVVRPSKIVVIGSKAGFSVVCFALGLKDNAGSTISSVGCFEAMLAKLPGKAMVYFIDPSRSEARGDPSHWHGIGFWDEPNKVREHWERFEVADLVHHYKMTSKQFLEAHRELRDIDLLYIDGDHSEEGVRHDFEQFYPRLKTDAIILAHDVDPTLNEIDPGSGGYLALTRLDPNRFEIFRLPLFPGLAIVRKKLP